MDFSSTKILISLFVLLQCLERPVAAAGTTKHIKEIFLGRCYEYQELTRFHSDLTASAAKKDCAKLFMTFEAAFEEPTNCSTNYTGYFDRFFTEANPGLTPNNKALFWSGTNMLAHDLSYVNKDYITLEDTFVGYMVNNLHFCGDNSVGFNYKNCTCAWSQSIAHSFWTAASLEFATNAQGVITVLLNGTSSNNSTAYRKTSFFGGVELPNLNASLVQEIRILVGIDLGKEPLETCGHNSIKILQDDIKKRNIKSTCIDDPNVVSSVLCAKYPSSSACKAHLRSISSKLTTWKIIGSVFIGVFGITLAVILVAILCWKGGKKSGEIDKFKKLSDV